MQSYLYNSIGQSGNFHVMKLLYDNFCVEKFL